MLRVFIIVTAFLTITLGLLIAQSDKRMGDVPRVAQGGVGAPISTQVVSRDLTGLDDLVELTRPEIVALPVFPAVSPSPQDLLADIYIPGTIAEAEEVPLKEAMIHHNQPITNAADVLSALDKAVLKASEALEIEQEIAREFDVVSVDTVAGDNKFLALTQDIVGKLVDARHTAPVDIPGLRQLVSEALMTHKSGSEIDAILVKAVRSGDILVPGTMLRADGRVDTKMILATLVEKTNAQTAPTKSVHHVVIRSDSLASISKSHYGTTAYANFIRDANRSLIPQAGILTAGQTLVLPSL